MRYFSRLAILFVCLGYVAYAKVTPERYQKIRQELEAELEAGAQVGFSPNQPLAHYLSKIGENLNFVYKSPVVGPRYHKLIDRVTKTPKPVESAAVFRAALELALDKEHGMELDVPRSQELAYYFAAQDSPWGAFQDFQNRLSEIKDVYGSGVKFKHWLDLTLGNPSIDFIDGTSSACDPEDFMKKVAVESSLIRDDKVEHFKPKTDRLISTLSTNLGRLSKNDLHARSGGWMASKSLEADWKSRGAEKVEPEKKAITVLAQMLLEDAGADRVTGIMSEHTSHLADSNGDHSKEIPGFVLAYAYASHPLWGLGQDWESSLNFAHETLHLAREKGKDPVEIIAEYNKALVVNLPDDISSLTVEQLGSAMRAANSSMGFSFGVVGAQAPATDLAYFSVPDAEKPNPTLEARSENRSHTLRNSVIGVGAIGAVAGTGFLLKRQADKNRCAQKFEALKARLSEPRPEPTYEGSDPLENAFFNETTAITNEPSPVVPSPVVDNARADLELKKEWDKFTKPKRKPATRTKKTEIKETKPKKEKAPSKRKKNPKE